MPYLNFMTDEHLFSCIKNLYDSYTKCQEEMTIKKFYHNRVDPIKFTFDMKFNDVSIEDYLLIEIAR